MHVLFSDEGNRDVIDKVVLSTAGKDFASSGSCRGAFSDDLVCKTNQFYILYSF